MKKKLILVLAELRAVAQNKKSMVRTWLRQLNVSRQHLRRCGVAWDADPLTVVV